MLGKKDDAARVRARCCRRSRTAFRREFVTAAGRVGENTQTAYALALQFDLLPEELRAEAARRLAAEVRTRGHLTTGFVGTPYLCHVLSRFGYTDVAYQLLNRQEYPSWLYPVKQGATTIWERWDGQKPDGSFQDAGMNSFNHYAYGAIGEWMYRVVAGLELDPRRARLQARARAAAARRRAHLGRGDARDALRRDGLRLVAREREAHRLGHGPAQHARHRAPARDDTRPTSRRAASRVAKAAGVTKATQDGDDVVVEVGSGRYEFAYDAARLVARLRPKGRLDTRVAHRGPAREPAVRGPFSTSAYRASRPIRGSSRPSR